MNSKEVSENLNARPYKCYHCHSFLGITTDQKLTVGAVSFRKHITLDCNICKKTTFWKPSKEIIKDIK